MQSTASTHPSSLKAQRSGAGWLPFALGLVLLLGAPAASRAGGCTAATAAAKAAKIAAHSWPNHRSEFVKGQVIAGRAYPGPTLTNESQLEAKVESVLGGYGVAIRDGRTKYWEASSGTIVIFNSRARDCGTAFRPNRGKRYYDEQ